MYLRCTKQKMGVPCLSSESTSTSARVQSFCWPLCLGKKLLEILRENGGAPEKMEVEVKRWRKHVLDKNKGGGWYTKEQLMETYRYTQCLAHN